MASRSEKIEELLWDLDAYYPDSEVLEDAWELFNENDDLPASLYKKLKRMMQRAVKEDAA